MLLKLIFAYYVLSCWPPCLDLSAFGKRPVSPVGTSKGYEIIIIILCLKLRVFYARRLQCMPAYFFCYKRNKNTDTKPFLDETWGVSVAGQIGKKASGTRTLLKNRYITQVYQRIQGEIRQLRRRFVTKSSFSLFNLICKLLL